MEFWNCWADWVQKSGESWVTAIPLFCSSSALSISGLAPHFPYKPLSVTLMYLVAIGWIYVVLMMSVAEATSSNGTVLGALITFVLYGVLPLALLMYIMGTPGRKRALRQKELAGRSEAQQAVSDAPDSGAAPDASGHAAGDTVAPVRKEP
jgi:hypothetical protein